MSDASKQQDPWSGRPQDDPDLRNALPNAIARSRTENPPVTAWLDAVDTIELFVDGIRRACVRPSLARADIFERDGSPAGSFTLLWSECAYEAVEKRLGMSPVAEVRDESEEGGGMISTAPRVASERRARDFRECHSGVDEVAHYLDRAVAVADLLGLGPSSEQQDWRREIDRARAGLADRDLLLACAVTEAALTSMDRQSILDWHSAWVDCARAVEALRRMIRDGSPP